MPTSDSPSSLINDAKLYDDPKTLSNLPSEPISNIIFLDSATLAGPPERQTRLYDLALVCRSWNVVASRALHIEPCFSSSRQIKEFWDTISSKPWGTPKGYSISLTRIPKKARDRSSVLSLIDLTSLLQSHPPTTILRIDDYTRRLGAIVSPSLPTELAKLDSITEFYFKGAALNFAWADCASCILGWQTLRHLTLKSIATDYRQLWMKTLPEIPLSLESLDLEGVIMTGPEFQRFLELCGSKLNRLRLRSGSLEPYRRIMVPRTEFAAMLVPYCEKLKYLSLGPLFFDGEDDDDAPSVPVLEHILAQVSRPPQRIWSGETGFSLTCTKLLSRPKFRLSYLRLFIRCDNLKRQYDGRQSGEEFGLVSLIKWIMEEDVPSHLECLVVDLQLSTFEPDQQIHLARVLQLVCEDRGLPLTIGEAVDSGSEESEPFRFEDNHSYFEVWARPFRLVYNLGVGNPARKVGTTSVKYT